jgi:hypothetical protein
MQAIPLENKPFVGGEPSSRRRTNLLSEKKPFAGEETFRRWMILRLLWPHRRLILRSRRFLRKRREHSLDYFVRQYKIVFERISFTHSTMPFWKKYRKTQFITSVCKRMLANLLLIESLIKTGGRWIRVNCRTMKPLFFISRPFSDW